MDHATFKKWTASWKRGLHQDSGAKPDLGMQWTFKQDNDTKQTAEVVNTWLTKNNFSVLEWTSQSWLRLQNCGENWRPSLKNDGKEAHQPQHLDIYVKEEWSKIPVEMCKKLVSMEIRPIPVIIKKGYDWIILDTEYIIMDTHTDTHTHTHTSVASSSWKSHLCVIYLSWYAFCCTFLKIQIQIICGMWILASANH